jgi:hypothetical protein
LVGAVAFAAIPLSIVTDGLSRMVSRKARWLGGGLLVVAFLLWSSTWVHLWFSGRHFDFGVPAETVIVRGLDEHLEPNTLLIVSIWGDYIDGELVYLLHDALAERQPMALYITDPRDDEWRTLLAEPREVLLNIDSELWYVRWLGLGDEIPGIVKHRDWSRVVYLIEDRPGVESDFEVLADRCPDLLTERIFVGEDSEIMDGQVLPRYHVWIARCDDHGGLRTPRFTVPALP